ncbi:MAG: hypothetical protein ACI9VR_000723 [Cognaticolwellia sp.]|jgi:hypothetical protein
MPFMSLLLTVVACVDEQPLLEDLDSGGMACAFLSPESGSFGPLGQDLDVQGEIWELSGSPEDLDLALSSDLDGELGVAQINADGTFSWACEDLSVGTHRIQLLATHASGTSCEKELLYSVGTPPTAEIVHPINDSVLDAVELVLRGTARDDQDAPGQLDALWLLDGEIELGWMTPDEFGELDLSIAAPESGLHSLTLRVVDPMGLYAESEVRVLLDAVPSRPVVGIIPDPATAADDLEGLILEEGIDLEGEAVLYSYEWWVDGQDSGLRTTDVPSNRLLRDQSWELRVTPTDGARIGETATATTTIGNAVPTLESAVLGPDPASREQSLTCTPGLAVDADSDALFFAYSWKVDGATIPRNGETLNPRDFAKGESVECFVQPDDARTLGLGVTSNAVMIQNAIPMISGVLLGTGAVYADSELSCSVSASDPDTLDTLTWSYDWSVDSVSLGLDQATLSGAFVKGNSVVCTGTVSDGSDSNSMASTAVVVANTAPSAPVASVNSGASAAEDLLCSLDTAATDIDGDSVSYSAQWFKDGRSYGGSTLTVSLSGDSIPASNTAAGDLFSCQIQASDGSDTALSASVNATVAP